MLKICKPTVIITSFALVVLGTLPAVAALGNVWTDFQYYVRDLRTYLTDNISENFQPLEVQTQTAITSTSDGYALPNPNAAANSVRDQIVQYSVSNRFENNPSVYGNSVGNEIDRYITRGAAEGVLGRDGQNRLKEKLEDTEQAVQDSLQFVQKAEQKKQEIEGRMNQFVEIPGLTGSLTAQAMQSLFQQQSQIIKLAWEGLSELELQNINIQNEQSKIMGETLGNTVQLRNDLQYSNLNLANISQQMDEVNRARRVDTSAEVARLLRVTSQTDLFRKSNNSAPTSLEELGDPSEEEPQDPSLEQPTEEQPSQESR
jgi:hypothetical protein